MKAKILTIVGVFVGACLILYMAVFAVAQFRGFIDPNYSRRMEKEYAQYSNDELFKKITGFHVILNEYAYRELAGREDERMVKPAIEYLEKGKSDYGKQAVIRALSKIDTARSKEALMGIVRKEKQDYEWSLALNGLSALKVEEAWPYVVAMAKEPYPEPARNGVLTDLVDFEKVEGLQFIDKMIYDYEKGVSGFSKRDYHALVRAKEKLQVKLKGRK